MKRTAAIAGLWACLACGGAPTGRATLPPPPTSSRAPLPPAPRAWTAKEYKDALAALSSGALPRASSEQFARIVDAKNLARYRDKNVPFGERFQDLGEVESAVGAMIRIYNERAATDASLGRELDALLAFVVHLSALTVELGDDLVLTLDPNDATFATRMGGFNRMRQGALEVVTGVLMTLHEPRTAPYGVTLLRDAGDDWVALAHRIGPGARRDVVRSLAALETATSDPATHQALVKTQSALFASPPPDVRIGSDGSATASTAPVDRTIEVEVDGRAPYRRVAAALRGLVAAGARKIVLRLPNEVGRVRWLRRVNDAPPAADIGLTALLVQGGISLKAHAGNVSPGCAGTGAGLAVPNRPNGTRDVAALAACAVKLKGAAAQSRSLTVSASDAVPFADVMATIETLGGPSLDLFPDLRFALPKK